MAPIEIYLNHQKSGKTHPLCMHAPDFQSLINFIAVQSGLSEEGRRRACQDGKVRINGILVLAYTIVN